MSNIKISVIVPIYGVEKYLKECVDSILAQTLNDIEIILIDDGGKDSCPEIIDEYARQDNRIIAIHKPNGGYGQTCNVGLKTAKGEYIAIVEPDDFIDSKMYEDLYKIAKQYDSDIVKSCFYENLQTPQIAYCHKTMWNDYIPEDKSFTIKEYSHFLYYHPSIWSCIYKREFLNKHNIKFVEAPGAGWTDNPFQVQTMCLAERINYTTNAYYYWRRVNLYESDDLKDWTIPFKRSEEIHNWLETNNINDENILFSLMRREFAYIGIVLGMRKISKSSECYKSIKKMLSRYSEAKILNSKKLREDEKNFYKSLKHLRTFRFKILSKRTRREYISIRFNSREKSFRIKDKIISFTK